LAMKKQMGLLGDGASNEGNAQ
ncbi:MAG: hypothetical protein RLZZ150_1253, partial [Bacteroidota bacterium]